MWEWAMTDVLNKDLFSTYDNANADVHDRSSPPASLRLSYDERIWRWVLRLSLPFLIFLSGKVLYWIWFDNIYGRTDWCDIIGGLPLALGTAVVTLWALGSWCSKDVW
jgi:hypothetical protein